MKEAHGRIIASAVAVYVVVALPMFLAGALALRIRTDLGLTATAFGSVVSAFAVTASITSPLAGRWVDRVGAYRSLRAAAIICMSAVTAVAALADSLSILATLMALAGLGFAIALPATNLAILHHMRSDRRALTFGIKQSAAPAAAMLAGVAVPLVATAVGWRGTFLLAATGPLIALGLVGRGPTTSSAIPDADPRTRTTPALPRTTLLLLAVSGGLATTTASTLPAFLVLSSVDSGLSESTSGILLAVGSLAGIATRITAGWIMDRRAAETRSMSWIAAMMACGAGGFLLLAFGESSLVAPAVVLAFGAGWGWPGLMQLAIVTMSPSAPGAATGIVATGLAFGGALGPLGFGVLVDQFSYGPAWMVGGLVLLGAAVLVWAARTRAPDRSLSSSQVA